MTAERVLELFIKKLDEDKDFYGLMYEHLASHILEGGVFEKYDDGDGEEELMMIVSKEEFNDLANEIANDFFQCLLGYPGEVGFSKN